MGKLSRLAAYAAMGAATVVLPAGAQANTLTLGTQFQGTIEDSIFDGGAGTVINTTLPSPLIASSPVDGTVIDWRISGGTTLFKPQVIHPAGGGLYAEVAEGTPQQGTGVGQIAGPFPTGMPISKGDFFGVAGRANARLGVIVEPGATYAYIVPPLKAGDPAAAPVAQGNWTEGISATVRYCVVPKLKGKKPKKAKTLLRNADCTFGGKKKSKKRRRKKKVVGQSVAPGTAISDTSPVRIKVSRKLK